MRILAVDDEKLICWALKRSFEKKLGYSVCCAYSGIEALEKIREREYDALITDLNMPDMNGVDLIKKVREMGMDIPVVVISSHFSMNVLDSILQYGVSRCISKPFQIEDVLVGIKEAANLPHPSEKVTVSS
ncbi:MAG: response regulator [Nitrospirae bacterium]|nr:MAG: response regulator [Nitrospirota bacterium]